MASPLPRSTTQSRYFFESAFRYLFQNYSALFSYTFIALFFSALAFGLLGVAIAGLKEFYFDEKFGYNYKRNQIFEIIFAFLFSFFLAFSQWIQAAAINLFYFRQKDKILHENIEETDIFTARQLFTLFRKHGLKLFAFSLFYSIIVSLGLTLAILPGIFLAGVFVSLPYIYLEENDTIVKTIKKAYKKGMKTLWRNIGFVVIFSAIVFIIAVLYGLSAEAYIEVLKDVFRPIRRFIREKWNLPGDILEAGIFVSSMYIVFHTFWIYFNLVYLEYHISTKTKLSEPNETERSLDQLIESIGQNLKPED